MTNAEIILMAVKQKSLPQFLFKFRACNDNTKRIFLNNELWFSNPLDFNDPFDCNTPIDNTFTIDQIKFWLKDSCGITDIATIDILSKELKNDPSHADKAVKKQ